MTSTTHSTLNPFTAADVAFVVAARNALPADMAVEMDERIARHASRIMADRGLSAEAAGIEAIEQVAAHLRSLLAAR
jgi:hypothetical protein